MAIYLVMKIRAHAYRHEFLTLLASFFWGSSFVAIKVGLDHLDPLWFVHLRLLWAALIMLALPGTWKWMRLYLGHRGVWMLGLTNALAYLTQFLGMQYTSASAAAFYVNVGVVFAALLSLLLLKERFTRVKTAGLILAVSGIFLLSTNGNPAMLTDRIAATGAGVMLLSGLFWALYLVLTKRVLMGEPVRIVPLTAAVLLLSSAVLSVPALLWGTWPQIWGLPQLTVLFYTIVFCTVVPFLLWTRGLQGISATVSAAVLLAEPIFAVFLAYPVLGELFKSLEAVGAVLILVAIAFISFAEEEGV